MTGVQTCALTISGQHNGLLLVFDKCLVKETYTDVLNFKRIPSEALSKENGGVLLVLKIISSQTNFPDVLTFKKITLEVLPKRNSWLLLLLRIISSKNTYSDFLILREKISLEVLSKCSYKATNLVSEGQKSCKIQFDCPMLQVTFSTRSTLQEQHN